MAVTALHSAATGLGAMSTSLDIIANNLANVNTHGFKAFRPNFEDLLYQERQQPGVENIIGDERPAGLYVGLGVKVTNTQIDFTKGNPIPTEQELDIMIDGNGLFMVTIPDDIGGIGYTRHGNFFRNADGDLVLGSADGPRLEPPINIADDITQVTITKTGQVTGFRQDGTRQEIGDIQNANIVNPQRLKPIRGNLHIATEASGDAILGDPGTGALGSILQGHIESSNVDPVKELVELIKTQRAFEMNSQSIQAADESLQVISNLRRF